MADDKELIEFLKQQTDSEAEIIDVKRTASHSISKTIQNNQKYLNVNPITSKFEEAIIEINGMTCHSCANNIEETVGRNDGIKSISVSLNKSEGRIVYDTSKWTAQMVIELITDMGFDAQLLQTQDYSKERSPPVLFKRNNSIRGVNESTVKFEKKAQFVPVNDDSIEKRTFSVEGMTCASCVAYIERNIGKLKGVHSVVVALMSSKAEVVFDSLVIAAEHIADEINLLGYRAAIIGDGFKDHTILNLLITGLSSQMCVHRIESHVIARKGVESCSVSLATSSARIEYTATFIGPRDIIKVIEDLGYSATVACHDEQLKRLDHSAEVIKWRISLLVSLLFGIPVMGIMIYFHWFLHTPMHPEMQTPVFIPALSLDNLILFALCTPVQLFGGKYFYLQSWKAVKHGSANMDVLIVLATTTSYLYSVTVILLAIILRWPSSPMTFFDVTPMLITFVSLGRWLEYKAKGKTSEALSKLMSLQAKEAVLITRGDDGRILSEENIDVELVQRGDLLKVVPGAKIPADGIVVDGKSAADESFVTGESMPVVKREGSTVIGGSVNQHGILMIQATHVGQETTLAQIVRLVEEAQTSKAPIQQTADRIAGLFVPTIIGLAILTLVAWIFVGLFIMDTKLMDERSKMEVILKRAFEAAITVLAIACPCSLGLATPTAVMVGTGIGAVNGILIKGGEPLEMAHKITTVVMDKTGTITKGHPRVVLIHTLISENHLSLLKLFAAIGSAESNSEHPIANSITSFVKEFLNTKEWATVRRFHASAGNGIACEVQQISDMLLSTSQEKELQTDSVIKLDSGDVKIIRKQHYNVDEVIFDDNKPFRVVIGNERWMAKNAIPVDEYVGNLIKEQQAVGYISVMCAINGYLIAIISIADVVKNESALAVWALRRMNIRVILLTGDNARTAEATARQVGIREVFAEVLPNQKRIKIEQLQEIKERVAMVGDGINDSPALASADVGIAIAAGSDVAIESAGIVLVKNDLIDVVAAIDLSKKTTRRIQLNFLFAVLYNVIGIPIAAGVFMPWGFTIQPWMAAAAMALSSVSVVASSLLLRLYRKPTQQSLACTEFYNHQARLAVGNWPVVVHRGLDDFAVRRTLSKLSFNSVISTISSIFGSQQSVNRITPRDRKLLLQRKSNAGSPDSLNFALSV
ncbi:Copper-transporting ATPase [Dirofilaria immitis]